MSETVTIEERLRRFAAAPEDADWQDVLRRADMAPRRRLRLTRRRLVVAVVIVAIALTLPALALSGALGTLVGFSNHGTQVPHSSLYTVHFSQIRPGSFVKLASREGQVVYAAHRKRSRKLCFLWGPANTTNFNGSCLAPGTFPSPSRPVWDMSAGYVDVPGLIDVPGLRPGVEAIHFLIGVAADAVRSVQVLAGPDCHPVATVPVIDNVYIDVLKPMTGEDDIVAREASGKVVWHEAVRGGPRLPSCGVGRRR